MRVPLFGLYLLICTLTFGQKNPRIKQLPARFQKCDTVAILYSGIKSGDNYDGSYYYKMYLVNPTKKEIRYQKPYLDYMTPFYKMIGMGEIVCACNVHPYTLHPGEYAVFDIPVYSNQVPLLKDIQIEIDYWILPDLKNSHTLRSEKFPH
jgi:hypothetical protein